MRVERLRQLRVVPVADGPEWPAVERGQRLQCAFRHGMPVGVEGAAADRQLSPLDSEAGLSRGGLGNAHRSRHDLVADVVALKHTQAQASGRHHNSFRCGATVQPAALRSVASGTDAAATAAARSRSSMAQARSSSARASASPITSFAWFMNLVSSCRSEEHTSELQSLMRTSYAVFCLNKKNTTTHEM